VGLTYLPQRLVDRLSEADRREYALHVGHPNAGLTSADLEHKRQGLAEKQLQNELRQYLSLKGILFICPPMFKKSMLPAGWPDFTFAHCGTPIVWEAKTLTGELRTNQELIVGQLVRCGWHFRLIRSLEDARRHLHEIEEGNR